MNAEVRAFLTELDESESWSPSAPDRVLATVLFTDIVDSSRTAAELGDRAWRELLEQHHALVRKRLMRFRGVEVDTAGDGFLASFDGPARAISCARARSSKACVTSGSKCARVSTPASARSSMERLPASPSTPARA